MNNSFTKAIFMSSAVYDAVLGILFLFFGSSTLAFFHVTEPYNMGFLHFPAMLLILFAIMYWKIANDPEANKKLIPYGMGLKFSYASVAFYHHFADDLPIIWVVLGVADTIFLVLFYLEWRKMN